MSICLSLDFGTNGVRAGIFDIETRELLSRGEETYPTAFYADARAEQSCADWWNALRRLVPSVLAAARRRDVSAISVAGFSSTVVFCDENGRALAPAILWMDARASEESDFSSSVDHPLIRIAGGANASEWLVPKAMWVRRNDRDLWSRTAIVCEALDYINHRLTGMWAGSMMNATCKWNFDSRTREFDAGLFTQLGVPDLTEKLPSNVVDIGAPIGTLLKQVAEELSISGTPLVAQGGIDAHMGMFAADTIAPGEMLMIGGTSNVNLTQIADDGRDISGVWGPYPNALTPGLRMIEAGQISAGSVLKWLTEEIYGLSADGLEALMHKASRIPPAADGLLVLEFWMGCRTPYKDARLRGSIMGLTLAHDRASLYRAATTGVVLGSANIVQDLQRQGVGISRLVLSGGITRNPLWLQATVDAIGKPAEIVREDHLTLVGGAAASSTALGRFSDMTRAANAWRVATEPLEPDQEQYSIYQELLGEYRRAVDLTKPVVHTLADRVKGSSKLESHDGS